ncbi:IscS subfamily cysteine desulfurase [Guptibacillus algicola]|uniref:IscS subfamily cysteine desulfurase n=1 Tax=Guptibacillus algicola TaxID=225844 RepID=UPI001CD70DB0|nr:IscS subfamily cysteine desulfurase [Alkalihalobacillus algicola]MCA0986988.1 IscS subfamily cysteine desulfurase [Alkalihalobacillus algicola]
MIYLDYAATTPMSERAIEVYTKVARSYFANSQSLHDEGTSAAQLLEIARQTVANEINGDPSGVYFTSGGTESNILAINGLVKKHKSGHLITAKAEHSSILNTFQQLEREGFDVTYLGYDDKGRIQIDKLIESLREDTLLVSIAHGNSEIGTRQPIEEIGAELAKRRILFHTDAVQTFGKVPIDVKSMNLTALSVSSHKLHGPKGVGACYIAPAESWHPSLPGTVHEKGFRPGTVDVPGIFAFTAAVEEATTNMDATVAYCNELRDVFLSECGGTNVVIEGGNDALSHIVGIRLKGIEGQYVMNELNQKGIAVSTGSACSIGQQSPSKTLKAMGRSDDEARELVRISFGKHTTKEEIVRTKALINGILSRFHRHHPNHVE